MANGLILAIDQGTTNTKALLVDRSGSPIFRTSYPVEILTTREGYMEQDPMALWHSVEAVSSSAVQLAKAKGASIEALAISNQRETAIAWSASTGEPFANAVGWQCNRSEEICERLAPSRDRFRSKTGLPLAPLVSAGKWAWLIAKRSAIKQALRDSDLLLGTVDAWLIHRITGSVPHMTDLTNASRTGLLNLEMLVWDPELLDLFGIPAGALPALRPTAGEFGTCRNLGDLAGIPLLAVVGDSHAAMFGHGHFALGAVKATYGTGSSLMALAPGLVSDTRSLARTIAWSAGAETQFALEGNIPMTGAAVQWLGEFLGLDNPALAVAQLASTVNTSDGIYFVPAMLGLGAPYWDANARGVISGLGRRHSSAHLARSALEAIAYQIADVFFSMESTIGLEFAELLVDGGATRNAILMQFQADILGRPVIRAQNEELSAIGAAWLAGLELGWWRSQSELETIRQDGERFEPEMKENERDRLYQGWKDAVSGARSAARSIR